MDYIHSFTRFSGLKFCLLYQEVWVDGEEWWKRRGGPPARNGADPDGWAGLRVPGQPRSCCSRQMCSPLFGAVARLSRDARSCRQRPRHVGAKPENCTLGDTQRWVPKLRHGGSELWVRVPSGMGEGWPARGSESARLCLVCGQAGRVRVLLNCLGLGQRRASDCFFQYLQML